MMTSEKCFAGFWGVRNFLFQIFIFRLAFDDKDVLRVK